MKKKKRTTAAYEVSGYVCIFCKECTEGSLCTNSSIYHVSEYDDVVGKLLTNNCPVPLVIHHFKDAVVGHVNKFKADDKGVYVTDAVIDNKEFLEYVTSVYEDTYSSILQNRQAVNLEAALKKQLTGFSLSHEMETGEVDHVGLVSEPARIGTLVRYKKSNIYHPRSFGNKEIVINRLTGMSWVFQDPKHKKYLLNNLSESKDTEDCTFLNASMNPNNMNPEELSQMVANMIPELLNRMNNNNKRTHEDDAAEDQSSNKCQKRDEQEQPAVAADEQQPPVLEPMITTQPLSTSAASATTSATPAQPAPPEAAAPTAGTSSMASQQEQQYLQELDNKVKSIIDMFSKEKEYNKNALNAMNNLILESQKPPKQDDVKMLYNMYENLSNQTGKIQQKLNSFGQVVKQPTMINASVVPTNTLGPNTDIDTLRRSAVDCMMQNIFGSN